MLVEGRVVAEGVGQVEDHVRAEGLQLLAQGVGIVEERQVFVLIAELRQGGDHAGLGLPGVRLEFRVRSSLAAVGRGESKRASTLSFLAMASVGGVINH